MAARPKQMTRIRVWATASLSTLALAALAAAPAGAASRPQRAAFALAPVGAPGAIVLRGAPGRLLRGAVSVRNLSDKRIGVRLQRADIADASNGNADYVTAGVHATGRWVHLRTRTVHLAPHATRRVGYAIRVPRAARGASHYAGIVAVDTAELAHAHAHAHHGGQSFTLHRIERQAIPITIRMRGRLVRRLALRSVRLDVQPVGAAVMLGLAPGGSALIQSTTIKFRVLRGNHTLFATRTTLGQLFPGAPLAYRIPWKGRPAAGTYRVQGTIRPQGAPMIRIDSQVVVTGAAARQLVHGTPAAAAQQRSDSSVPEWVWIALALAAVLLVALPSLVWRHARRVGSTPATGS